MGCQCGDASESHSADAGSNPGPVLFVFISFEKILKRILERKDGMVWSGSNWLRIGTNGGLL
jgi:hypothetical protein